MHTGILPGYPASTVACVAGGEIAKLFYSRFRWHTGVDRRLALPVDRDPKWRICRTLWSAKLS
jgi:hypothetical protein